MPKIAKKAFQKRVEKFLSQNERMTSQGARKLIRVVKDARNEILQTIRNVPLTQWQAWYLPQLREQLDRRLDELQKRLVVQMNSSQKSFFEYSVSKADELAKVSGIVEMPLVYLDPTVLQATQTLSAELVKTIPLDLRKKLGNRLSLGILGEKSAQQVAHEIVGDKVFGLSFNQAEKISRTELMRTQSIAQEKRFQQIVELDPTVLKTWVWSGKPDGRKGHQEAEAKYSANPIPFGEYFRVRSKLTDPYIEIMFPRSPDAIGSSKDIAANTIFCGCLHLLQPKE